MIGTETNYFLKSMLREFFIAGNVLHIDDGKITCKTRDDSRLFGENTRKNDWPGSEYEIRNQYPQISPVHIV